MVKKKILYGLVGAIFLMAGCAGLTKRPETTKAEKLHRILAKYQEPRPVTENETPAAIQTESSKPEESPLPLSTQKSASDDLNLERKKAEETNERFEKVIKTLNSPTESVSKKKTTKTGSISFNFDNADLYEVIRTMADLLGINYIVDPNIRGKVTIHTAGEFEKSDLFPLFYQILELNGLTALREGGLYKILNKDKITTTPILTRYGRDIDNISPQERMVMQIVPLKYIAPQAIIPTITPFLSDSGKIISKEDSDLLIIIEKNGNLKRILQLVDVFDVDVFDNISHEFFRLQHIEADEMAGLINELMGPYLKIDQSELKVISIQRLNTIVAISSNQRILEKIGLFISKIDAKENSADPRIFIYKVRNSDAEDIASLLNQVFVFKDEIPGRNLEKDSGKVKNKGADGENEAAPKLFDQPDTKKVKPKTYSTFVTDINRGIGSSDSLSGEVKIIPDTTRNLLIIEAVPSDYVTIKQILQELDVMPRQVLIDVLILDVNITETTTLGVEWSFLKGRGGDTGLLQADLGSTTKGLVFTAGLTKDWIAAVEALAVDDRADVLSAPSVLASDNKPATINVVTQIPVTTSSYDTDNGVTTTTVQYRDTGIILSVTPQINDDGMVSMEISQEVSSVVDSSSDAANPSFFNRNVQTTLSVRDNQTIVIGGLISETQGDNSSGVPGLSSLPIIGFLFGEKKDSKIKNELIIMITPRVINGLNDIESVSREFKSKFSDLRIIEGPSDLLPDQ